MSSSYASFGTVFYAMLPELDLARILDFSTKTRKGLAKSYADYFSVCLDGAREGTVPHTLAVNQAIVGALSSQYPTSDEVTGKAYWLIQGFAIRSSHIVFSGSLDKTPPAFVQNARHIGDAPDNVRQILHHRQVCRSLDELDADAAKVLNSWNAQQAPYLVSKATVEKLVPVIPVLQKCLDSANEAVGSQVAT